ncbi:MAG: DUF2780 domain-containing protein [Methylococcales bacterium]|nr:DUF2780 domain-containing protein [Methylococcales bacterium]MDD5753194.1 DUF2780 domain-containing protein [Methylococcales bacterium]
MKSLKTTITFLCLIAAPLVHAENWGDVLKSVSKESSHTLENSADAINQAQTLLESGKTLKAGELTNVLVQRLGVTPQQAMGGAGALLQIAQTRMNPEAFAKLSQQVPDVSQLLSAVPALQPQSGLGGLAGKLAGLSGDNSISTALTAVSLFQQLGMKPETMQRFIPVVVEYVKGNTGSAIAEGLGVALSAPNK